MATITQEELTNIITEAVLKTIKEEQVNEGWKSTMHKIGHGLKTAGKIATAGAIGAGILSTFPEEEEPVDPMTGYRIEQVKKNWAEERGLDINDPSIHKMADEFFGPSDDTRDWNEFVKEYKPQYPIKSKISESRINSIVHNVLRKYSKA